MVVLYDFPLCQAVTVILTVALPVTTGLSGESEPIRVMIRVASYW